MSDKEPRWETGHALRKRVMGEEHVARAEAAATAFDAPLQDLLTRHAWGDVWAREGLDAKTRSLVTVAMLVALGKPTELGGHVRGALNNGASAVELREVLLHAAVYCGVPAAAEAFRAAAKHVPLDGLG
jgi:4-carboxymuconolactone decarboxylase